MAQKKASPIKQFFGAVSNAFEGGSNDSVARSRRLFERSIRSTREKRVPEKLMS